jgi:hypothetical protein
MKKISSRNTFFMKKIFPVLWLGFTALAAAAVIFSPAPRVTLVGPVFVALIGLVVMKAMIWDLADEVYDCGDSLLVKNAGREERVALSNIMNVSATTLTNPPRISLRLIHPVTFGLAAPTNEIVFSPIKPISLNPFAKNAIAEDLIVRVHRAKSESRR